MPVEIGFIGLGAMGLGMALSIVRDANYVVKGYDARPSAVDEFARRGGRGARSCRDAAAGSMALVCMAATAEQVDSILFEHESGALQALPQNAIVLVSSTVPPSYIEALPARVTAAGRADILLVDCPVSGGSARAEDGSLTIFVSGTDEAMSSSDALLQAMSQKLYHIRGGIGAASKVKMVNQLLVGTHIAAAAEAIGLASKAGLDVSEVFGIVSKAAGSSWAFQNRVPHMMAQDWTPLSALNIFVKDMGIVMSAARHYQFPLPMASVAEQLYVLGAAQGYGLDDDSGLVRVFLHPEPMPAQKQHTTITPSPAAAEETDAQAFTAAPINKVAAIGLGAMGLGMASSIVRQGYSVHGFDVFEPSVQRFAASGDNAHGAASAQEAARDADILIMVVQNAQQAHDVLFGEGGAAAVLSPAAVVILCSTVPPAFIRGLEKELHELHPGTSLLDAPVSGGAARAAEGNLVILCSGQESVFSRARGILSAMTGNMDNLCYVQGGVGAASSIKMINQLLAGVHIATAAEAFAFAAHIGLDTQMVFEVIQNAAGWSWMLENRAPQMLQRDWTPFSSLAIFVKDLGIVLDEAKRLACFTPMSSTAHGLYLAGSSKGWSKSADAAIIRLWDTDQIKNA